MEEILFEKKGETLIIYLPNELDHHAAAKIREQTDELFAGKRVRDVIFDYHHTYFMDSSGIGLVMGRYREVRYLKGNVFIVGVNDKVARFLDISGLYRVAKRCPDADTALAFIQNNREKREELE
ncbi:MAG: anti-sigma factor antagonist [Eubacteriales bacterium]|nr:anti-sigma factor antagonist [Eubacteriales bacterium]